jgi:hypothetical protein
LIGQLLDARDTVRQILLADSIADIRSFGLDADLRAAQALREQVDQLAGESRSVNLAFSLQIAPPP